MTTRPPVATVLVVHLAMTTFAAFARAEPATRPSVPAELLDEQYLYEVVRHLYRWYLDEADALKVTRDKQIVFWVRRLHTKLDPGDRSVLGQIILPKLGVSARVKKADYVIEEYGAHVKNDRFKIINVSRISVPARPPSDVVAVKVDHDDMRDYLFKTRMSMMFPEGKLLESLRAAAREEILEDQSDKPQALAKGRDQIVHLSSISPVANEVWIFWETGRLLLRFASDFDLTHPAVWDHEELSVDLYDIDEQVVVSLDEVAGSNAYMTRDQVGRALFNCIVLGRRLVLEPPKPSAIRSGLRGTEGSPQKR